MRSPSKQASNSIIHGKKPLFMLSLLLTAQLLTLVTSLEPTDIKIYEGERLQFKKNQLLMNYSTDPAKTQSIHSCRVIQSNGHLQKPGPNNSQLSLPITNFYEKENHKLDQPLSTSIQYDDGTTLFIYRHFKGQSFKVMNLRTKEVKLLNISTDLDVIEAQDIVFDKDLSQTTLKPEGNFLMATYSSNKVVIFEFKSTLEVVATKTLALDTYKHRSHEYRILLNNGVIYSMDLITGHSQQIRLPSKLDSGVQLDVKKQKFGIHILDFSIDRSNQFLFLEKSSIIICNSFKPKHPSKKVKFKHSLINPYFYRAGFSDFVIGSISNHKQSIFYIDQHHSIVQIGQGHKWSKLPKLLRGTTSEISGNKGSNSRHGSHPSFRVYSLQNVVFLYSNLFAYYQLKTNIRVLAQGITEIQLQGSIIMEGISADYQSKNFEKSSILNLVRSRDQREIATVFEVGFEGGYVKCLKNIKNTRGKKHKKRDNFKLNLEFLGDKNSAIIGQRHFSMDFTRNQHKKIDNGSKKKINKLKIEIQKRKEQDKRQQEKLEKAKREQKRLEEKQKKQIERNQKNLINSISKKKKNMKIHHIVHPVPQPQPEPPIHNKKIKVEEKEMESLYIVLKDLFLNRQLPADQKQRNLVLLIAFITSFLSCCCFSYCCLFSNKHQKATKRIVENEERVLPDGFEMEIQGELDSTIEENTVISDSDTSGL